MVDVRIRLSFAWVAITLAFIYGDILRMVAGDMPLGEINGTPATPIMMFGISVLMSITIVMSMLTLILNHKINRRLNIIVAGFWLAFLVLDIGSFIARPYDLYLIVIGALFTCVIIWWSLRWRIAES
jgi:hypothetical protein